MKRIAHALLPAFLTSVVSVILASSQVYGAPLPVTYQFIGNCEDCTGTGVGTLVLSNYTQGDNLNNSNFVSFSYTSNLLPEVTILSSDLTFFGGSIPADLPSAANVFMASDSLQFSSSSTGEWCIGKSCLADFGNTSVWAAASTSGVPEPTSFVLVGGAVLLMSRRRWRNSIRRSVS